METKIKLAEGYEKAREFLVRHSAHYEVSPYFVLLDVRTIGTPPSHRKIPAGFDLDLYGTGVNGDSLPAPEDGDLHVMLSVLGALCHEVALQAGDHCTVEMIPFEGTLVLNAKRHFEPEALLRIRITHARGIEQPSGASEEKALTDLRDSLDFLGVKKS